MSSSSKRNAVSMPWTAGSGHGFTEPGVTPWLPFGEDADTRNVEIQSADPWSHLNFMRRLLVLRRDRPSLHRGTIEILEPENPDVLVYVRTAGAERTMIAINFADEPRSVPVPAIARLLVATDGPGSRIGNGLVEVAPHQAVMIDPGLVG